MPIGKTYAETGLIAREGHELILQRDGGGRWRLDAWPGAEKLTGRRVKIVGRRSGFDLLDVSSLAAIER